MNKSLLLNKKPQNNWQKVKLGDIADIIGGGTPSTKNYDFWNGDISWLTPKDLSGYKERYISKGERNITTSGLQNSSARLLPKGTVLLTSRAPIGYLAIAKQEVCTNQGFKSIVLKSGYSPEFFYYLLKNNMEYIIGMSSGSTFAEISGTQVKNLEFNIPDYDTQKKIAGVLGALDDKIELNNKINQNLEAQAQALFKSWFVDFEPFGGQMPDDWKIKTIGDVCASISETYNRKDENVVLINTSDVLNGEILTHSLVKNENLKGQFKKTFQKNDILYSEIRPINKRFAFVDIENTYNYIASTKLMVIRPDTSKISPLILYRILKSQDLIDELQHLAETRSGTFPQITFASELAIQKIVLAPLNEQKIISNVLEVLENKIRKNIQENLRLAELRDTLLPKLMSGEINVDDVKID